MLNDSTKEERFRSAVVAGVEPRIGKREMATARNCTARTLDRWVAEKRFPRPERIGTKKVGWPASLANKTMEELEQLAGFDPVHYAEVVAKREAKRKPPRRKKRRLSASPLVGAAAKAKQIADQRTRAAGEDRATA
jgi:predicted DNA-binding transcriptional regulator AlpA